MARLINIDSILGQIPAGEKERLRSVSVDGARYWVKRYDCEDRPGYKLLHKVISVLPIPAWSKQSEPVDAAGAVARELRKIDAFRAIGFKTAKTVYSDEVMVIAKDAGVGLDHEMKALREAGNKVAHDEILCEAAYVLGLVHAAGLVHGRPHIRDMFRRGRKIGFLDFEEEPETVMPIAFAQARDCWLFFLFAADLALLPGTGQKAWQRYTENAPADLLLALREIFAFWHRVIWPLKLLRLTGFSSDLRRIVKADEILENAFRKN